VSGRKRWRPPWPVQLLGALAGVFGFVLLFAGALILAGVRR